MSSASSPTLDDRIISELESIKRLLLVALFRNGATQEQLAAALKISQASVSRMLPAKLFAPKKAKKIKMKPKRKLNK